MGAARTRPAGEVRIIGGAWKRTRLPVPDLPGLRPTPDRVRETLFNWLGQDLTGWHVVDAFAGTGALGLEAASRGAASVLLVEREARLVAALQAVTQRLAARTVRVERGDGLARLAALPQGSVHLVLLDPPFDANLSAPALQAAARACAAGGFIYLEAPHPVAEGELQVLGLRPHRHLRAGMVHASLLVNGAGEPAGGAGEPAGS